MAEIPLLLAIDKRPTMPDPRFDVHKPLSAVPARFPLGSLAISMDPRHFGAVVRVKSHDSRNARVLVEIKTEPKTPSFLPSLIEKHINEKYYSPRDVCRMVGISNVRRQYYCELHFFFELDCLICLSRCCRRSLLHVNSSLVR